MRFVARHADCQRVERVEDAHPDVRLADDPQKLVLRRVGQLFDHHRQRLPQAQADAHAAGNQPHRVLELRVEGVEPALDLELHPGVEAEGAGSRRPPAARTSESSSGGFNRTTQQEPYERDAGRDTQHDFLRASSGCRPDPAIGQAVTPRRRAAIDAFPRTRRTRRTPSRRCRRRCRRERECSCWRSRHHTEWSSASSLRPRASYWMPYSSKRFMQTAERRCTRSRR